MEDDYLHKLIAGNPLVDPNKIVAAVSEGIQFYQDQIAREMYSAKKRRRMIRDLYAAVDHIIKQTPPDTMKQVKCTKGCAHCCKIPVDVSLSEAEYILNFCKQNNIPIDVEYLKHKAQLIKEDHMFSKYRNCMFLAEDESCKIYEARPISCRKYLVMTDPIFCDYSKDKAQVQYLSTLQADLIVFGLFAADRETGVFPYMLLRAMEI